MAPAPDKKDLPTGAVTDHNVSPLRRQALADLIMPLGAAFMLAAASREQANAANTGALKPESSPTPHTTNLVRASDLKVSLYRVQSGDTLSEIAKRYNVTQDFLRSSNPGLNPQKLSIGQTIRLPVQPDFHMVTKGDTFQTIAHERGVTVKQIVDANPHVDPRRLAIGQAISIPSAEKIKTPSQKEPALPSPATSSVHIVKANENPSTIAKQHGISTAALLSANPGLDPRALRIGQKLSLPGQVKTIAAALTNTQPQVAATPLASPVPQPSTISDPRFCKPLPAEEAPSFFTFIKRALGFEGMKVSDDPNDRGNQGPGKITNCGITGVAVKQHIITTQNRTPSNQEIAEVLQNLTLNEAITIYATGYWKREYHAIPPKVAFLLFDWGINSSPTTTLHQLQKALNLPSSPSMDDRTIASINALGEERACALLTSCRKNFYERLIETRPSDQKYRAGWLHRADSALEFANSSEFTELRSIFQSTAHKGCDFFDPVRVGHTILKRHSTEHALIRHLQERLTKAGYEMSIDGAWGTEMDRVVTFFKERHRLPGGPAWGKTETEVLDALTTAQGRGDIAAASTKPIPLPRL
jgi:LysM repeat protein/lysozyme family protein